MSIKFRRDGAVFPTEVKDGKLRIFIGSQFREIPLKFLKDDYPYDATAFPQCNVMCYLENDSKILIMRYNGTITVYTKDRVVIGFGKFEVRDLYSQTDYFPIGICSYESKVGAEKLFYCTLYRFKGEKDEYALENLNSLKPYFLKLSDNPELIEDLATANRAHPRYRPVDGGYVAGEKEYFIKGTELQLSGYLKI